MTTVHRDNNTEPGVPDQIAAALTDSAKADFDKVAFAVGLFTIGSLGTVCAFELLRRRNKRVYEPKRKYADAGGPAPPNVGYSIFGWVEPVWSYTEAEMLHTAGLDAVVFLRFLRLCCWLTTILATLLAAVLIPIDVVYNVKERSKDLQTKKTRLSILSLAEMYGKFLYVHIGMSYICCIVSLYLIFRNYRHLVSLRWAYFRSEAYQRSFAARTLLLTNVHGRLRSDYALKSMLSSIGLPYPTTAVHIGRNVGALPALIEEHEQRVRQLELVIARYLKNPEKLPAKRPTMRINKFVGLFGGSRVDSIDYLTSEINRLETAITSWRDRIGEREPESYGFASLASIPHAHAAAKALKGKKPFEVKATLAPEPRDIIWKNLNLTHMQRFGLNVTGFVTLVFVAILMAAPLLAVALIAQMSSFTGTVPALKQWQDASSLTFNIVAGVVPPAISIVLNWSLPFVMRKLAKYRGERTRTDLDKAVTAQYFAFQVISQFILFSLLGIMITSIATVVTEISEHMSGADIFKTLREQTVVLRKQFLNTSNYWLTWLPVRMWQSTYDLVQGHKLIAVWLHKMILGGRTPRHMRQFAHPPTFEYAIQYGDFLFLFAVATAYGCLVPLVMVFAALTFWVSLGCYKYSLMYVARSKVESGGQLWRVIANRLLFCLIFMQLILMWVVSLDDTVSLMDRIIKTALCAPPIAMVIAFKFYCARRFDQQYDWYLPDREEMAHVKVHGNDEQRNRLQRRFCHPCMEQELFTPLVHAKLQPYLPQVYRNLLEKQSSVVVAGHKCESHEVAGGLTIAAMNDSQLEFDPRLDSDAQSVMTMTTVGQTRRDFGSPSRPGTADSAFAAKHSAYLAGGDLSTPGGEGQYELHMIKQTGSRDNLLLNGAAPGEDYFNAGHGRLPGYDRSGVATPPRPIYHETPPTRSNQNVRWRATMTNMSANASTSTLAQTYPGQMDSPQLGRAYPYPNEQAGEAMYASSQWNASSYTAFEATPNPNTAASQYAAQVAHAEYAAYRSSSTRTYSSQGGSMSTAALQRSQAQIPQSPGQAPYGQGQNRRAGGHDNRF